MTQRHTDFGSGAGKEHRAPGLDGLKDSLGTAGDVDRVVEDADFQGGEGAQRVVLFPRRLEERVGDSLFGEGSKVLPADAEEKRKWRGRQQPCLGESVAVLRATQQTALRGAARGTARTREVTLRYRVGYARAHADGLLLGVASQRTESDSSSGVSSFVNSPNGGEKFRIRLAALSWVLRRPV